MITDFGLQEVKFTVLSDFYQIFALFRVEKYLKFHSKTQACLISDFLLKFASYQLSVINLVHLQVRNSRICEWLCCVWWFIRKSLIFQYFLIDCWNAQKSNLVSLSLSNRGSRHRFFLSLGLCDPDFAMILHPRPLSEHGKKTTEFSVIFLPNTIT